MVSYLTTLILIAFLLTRALLESWVLSCWRPGHTKAPNALLLSTMDPPSRSSMLTAPILPEAKNCRTSMALSTATRYIAVVELLGSKPRKPATGLATPPLVFTKQSIIDRSEPSSHISRARRGELKRVGTGRRSFLFESGSLRPVATHHAALMEALEMVRVMSKGTQEELKGRILELKFSCLGRLRERPSSASVLCLNEGSSATVLLF